MYKNCTVYGIHLYTLQYCMHQFIFSGFKNAIIVGQSLCRQTSKAIKASKASILAY